MEPCENAGIFGSFARGRMISSRAIKYVRSKLDQQSLQQLQMKENFNNLCDALQNSTTAYTRSMRKDRSAGYALRSMAEKYEKDGTLGKKHIQDVVDGRYELDL